MPPSYHNIDINYTNSFSVGNATFQPGDLNITTLFRLSDPSFSFSEGLTEYKTSKLTLSHLMTAKDDRKTEMESKGCCALHRLETRL